MLNGKDLPGNELAMRAIDQRPDPKNEIKMRHTLIEHADRIRLIHDFAGQLAVMRFATSSAGKETTILFAVNGEAGKPVTKINSQNFEGAFGDKMTIEKINGILNRHIDEAKKEIFDEMWDILINGE